MIISFPSAIVALSVRSYMKTKYELRAGTWLSYMDMPWWVTLTAEFGLRAWSPSRCLLGLIGEFLCHKQSTAYSSFGGRDWMRVLLVKAQEVRWNICQLPFLQPALFNNVVFISWLVPGANALPSPPATQWGAGIDAECPELFAGEAALSAKKEGLWGLSGEWRTKGKNC